MNGGLLLMKMNEYVEMWVEGSRERKKKGYRV